MSKLSEFTEHLAQVKPNEGATISYEGCIFLIKEINRIQGVAKQALLDQRSAEKKLSRYIEREPE